ncbi:hypothetical protein CR513_53420, partial [Mucuna pruriens]
MYDTIFRNFGITFPFNRFEAEVLRTLNVAPSQLHPNRWVAMQAIQVMCHCLRMEPTTAKFLVHYVKSGWVSLTNVLNSCLFNAYYASYKLH